MRRMILIITVLLFSGAWALGQVHIPRKDTMLLGIPVPLFIARDSTRHEKDTLTVQGLYRQEKKDLQKKWSEKKKETVALYEHKPSAGIKFTGGYANYSFNYRSDLDTPYVEKNLVQHQIISTLNYTIAGLIPIRVNTFIRRSNSSIFQNITDVQVAFDAAAYRNGLLNTLRDRSLRQAPSADSLAGKLYRQRLDQAGNLEAWLKDPLTKQKLIEANEIVKVPHITYNMSLPDSLNRKHEDSLRKEAAFLLELYEKAGKLMNRLHGQADSLKRIYDQSEEKANKYRQLLSNARPGDPTAALPQGTPENGGMSKAEKFLLGVRNFGIGRNNINHSELTARNISLNGVNFEYNSWYYLAFSAGLVDYRFRDFVIQRLKQTPQYMYVARAGLGRLEKNYFIVSAFGGRKQLLTSINSAGYPTIQNVSGVTTEVKWQLQPMMFVQAEAGQSFSPDLQVPPPVTKPGWNLSNMNNKALSVKFSAWFPASASRLEAQFKFMGSNYQSFTAFQTNAEQKTWSIRGEQNFFKRQLKIVASVKTSDFSNPYIIQNYKANTVFKTLSATFHRKNLPTVTIAYMPMTQLTKVDSLLEQSQFHTLNVSISHFYKLGDKRASTNLVYTRFFNGSSDTGFIYYNSTNLYIAQSIFFRDFTSTLGLSHSQNMGYRYNVLEGNVSVPLGKKMSAGLGAKLNNLNETYTGVGGFADASFGFDDRDKLTVHFEKGYLPGSGSAPKLVANTLGMVSFIKTFK